MSKTLEDLLGGEDIDEVDDGDTRLMLVLQGFCGNDIENDALTLIRAGCDLDWQSNVDGMTAIHWACRHEQIKVVVEMIERNVKLDARDHNGGTCFMNTFTGDPSQHRTYDCAFAVMDAGGTVNLMEMKLEESCLRERRDPSTWTFMETNDFRAPPLLVLQGAERRLQEIDQVRESFKNWSTTLVEEEILPFIYCENNLKYLKNFGTEKTLENAFKKRAQKRKHCE